MSARLSGDEITAILRGETSGPADGASLGAAVGRLRATYERSPQASAVLAAFLEGESGLSPAQPDTVSAPERAPRTRRRRGWRVVRWVTAIGLTGQVALGSAVAVAATTGAGLAERLPGPAQAAFDELVDALAPSEAGDVPGSGGLPPAEFRPPAHPVVEELGDDRHSPRPVASEDGGEGDKPVRKPRRVRDRGEPTPAASGTTGAEQPASPTPSREDAGPTRPDRDARDRQRDAADDARDRRKDAADDARDAQEDAAEESQDAQEDAADDARDAQEDAVDAGAGQAEGAAEEDD